jgi:uncharacterized protein YutE (UPF0331/DUF86 family)
MLIGHIRQVSDALDRDLLIRLSDEITAADFSSFLDHARYYHQEGKKMESSVIAAAVYEDTIRRLAEKYGIDRTGKVDSIISSLKRQGILSGVDAQKLRYYAGIRNSALHAAWEEFEIADVGDLIGGVETLIRDEADTCRYREDKRPGDRRDRRVREAGGVLLAIRRR